MSAIFRHKMYDAKAEGAQCAFKLSVLDFVADCGPIFGDAKSPKHRILNVILLILKKRLKHKKTQ